MIFGAGLAGQNVLRPGEESSTSGALQRDDRLETAKNICLPSNGNDFVSTKAARRRRPSPVY
jgi:hypothetical protein